MSSSHIGFMQFQFSAWKKKVNIKRKGKAHNSKIKLQIKQKYNISNVQMAPVERLFSLPSYKKVDTYF